MGNNMKNIVLIGMPGTGKSVVGRALADRLGYTFVDVDDLIVADAGKTLPQILRTEGLEAFLKIEARVGASLKRENTVIATGGIAQFVVPLCKREINLERDLLLKGLNIIYKKNAHEKHK